MLARGALVVACLLTVWGLVIVSSGGVHWQVAGLRISSTDPTRPFLLATLAVVFYAWLESQRANAARIDFGGAKWLSRSFALAIAILVLCAGLRWGAYIAGGSDSYGYLSQAQLWRSRTLSIEQPWVQKMPWPDAEWTFAPVGYRPGPVRYTIVPTYPPGLPAMFALLTTVFGGAGVRLLVPLLAASGIWITFLLGRDATESDLAGAIAAAVLAASPVFLFMSMYPMSDVPVTTVFAVACWVGFVRPVNRPLLAGLACGMALLIRPNLMLLAAVPPLAWARQGLRNRRVFLSRFCWYGAGLAPAILALAVLNTHLYGAPWRSGYGDVHPLFSIANIVPNARNFSSWLVDTQTVLFPLSVVALALPAALTTRKDVEPMIRTGFTAAIVLTVASYLFYVPLDAWWDLRFLLPVFPIVCVLAAAAVLYVCRAIPSPRVYLAIGVLCAALVVIGPKVAIDRGAFDLRRFEQRYVDAAKQVDLLTPPNAIVLSQQHSGSVRYYAHRITLRYNFLSQEWVDRAVQFLNEHGYSTYALLEDWEERDFRAQFKNTVTARQLDSPPVAIIAGSNSVRLYKLTR